MMQSCIAEYSDTFHVAPLMSLIAKVFGFNLLLLVFVPAALLSSHVGSLSSLLPLVMAICAIEAAGFAWRLRHFGCTRNA